MAIEKNKENKNTKSKLKVNQEKATAIKKEAKKETKKEVNKAEPVKEVESIKEVESVKRKFEPSDLIPVSNMFAGTCSFVGKKTSNIYTWVGLGTTEYVEYQDLRAECLNKRSGFIYEPLLIIEDEDFYAEFPALVELYKNIVSQDEIVRILTSGTEDELINMIKTAPSGLKDTIKSTASTLIYENSLDSLSKIGIVDRMLGTELIEIASQFK